MRILLIEDNPADAALVIELLREHAPDEFELAHCRTLAAAHDRLLTWPADCALLDLSLPDASGLEGVDQMQERHRVLPLVVLTGNPDDQLALRAVYRGAQDFLVKRASDAGQLARALRYAVERKRAEQEVEVAKDRFFASVSHDLRTPLTCIIGYLEELAAVEAAALSPTGRQFLDIATVNAERLRRLVNDVLFMATLRGGEGLELDCAEADLGQVVRMTAGAIQPFADDKGITLSAACESLPMWGDAGRLAQVVDNLLSNAIRYTLAGGRVDVRVCERDRRAALEVADTGIGIDPRVLETVFDHFYRAQPAREVAVSGVGLGLSIVKTIVDAHGGQVWVESRLGQGSRFTVTLPLPVDDARQGSS
jgi:signal transduction histidine kinase